MYYLLIPALVGSSLVTLYVKLLDNSRKPSGRLGRRMLGIWDETFRQMQIWGAAQLDPPAGAEILDIGAGSGQSSSLLAALPNSGRVVASDLTEAAVSRMKETIRNPKIEIVQASVLDLPFADCSFDVVTAFQTHFHWKPFNLGIAEVRRVLRPGGIFLIVSEADKPRYHLKEYSEPASMIDYLHLAGFEAVKVESSRKWISYQMTRTA